MGQVNLKLGLKLFFKDLHILRNHFRGEGLLYDNDYALRGWGHCGPPIKTPLDIHGQGWDHITDLVMKVILSLSWS